MRLTKRGEWVVLILLAVVVVTFILSFAWILGAIYKSVGL